MKGIERIMKFYENNVDHGIIYDWKKVCKQFNKIVPKGEYFNPTKINFDKSRINFLLSERVVGKTTNVIILGMVANNMYNIRLHYVRNKQSEIRSSIVSDLFTTINKLGYVEKVTNGRWHQVRYFPQERKFYYVNLNDHGDIEEKAEECLMYCMSIDKSADYKSGYACNNADFIIVDEFINLDDYRNRFIELQDLLITLIRYRYSPIVFFLANTIDMGHYIFEEYLISDEVQVMCKGDREYFTNDKGFTIYVEYINEERVNEKKKNVNRLYFGFENKKLNAITGVGWTGNEYKHFEKMKNDLVLMDNVYIQYHKKLERIKLIERENGEIVVFVHKATKTYDDSVIYTTEVNDDVRCRYLYGYGDRLDKLLMMLYDHKAFRYATNNDGLIVEKFYNAYKNK